jgi:hypothetical protein
VEGAEAGAAVAAAAAVPGTVVVQVMAEGNRLPAVLHICFLNFLTCCYYLLVRMHLHCYHSGTCNWVLGQTIYYL